MLTPTVIELPRRLEPVSHDPFADECGSYRRGDAESTVRDARLAGATRPRRGDVAIAPERRPALGDSQRALVIASLALCPHAQRAVRGGKR